MYLQQNCLYKVARRARHTAVSVVSWSRSICTTEQRSEQPDSSAFEKGDAACASQLCTHRSDFYFFWPLLEVLKGIIKAAVTCIKIRGLIFGSWVNRYLLYATDISELWPSESVTLDSTVCVADHTDKTGIILSSDSYHTILLQVTGSMRQNYCRVRWHGLNKAVLEMKAGLFTAKP